MEFVEKQPISYQEIYVRHPVRSLALGMWLQLSGWGRRWDLAQLILSIGSCSIYIAEQYSGAIKSVGILPAFKPIEILIAMIILCDLALCLYVSQNRFRTLMSVMTLIDLLIVVPVFLEVSTESVHHLPGIFSLRVLRLFRVFRGYRVLQFQGNSIRRQTLVIALTLFTILYITAGVMQIIEHEQHLTFVQAIYFAVVTVATVGYGDITCHTDTGRVFTILVIAFVIFVLPVQTSKLFNIITEKAGKWRGRYRVRPEYDHVLLIGDIHYAAMSQWLSEFFHLEHFNQALNVVVLNGSLPSSEMRSLLFSPLIGDRIKYLQGSPLVEDDLNRVGIEKALACFVLVDKHADDPKQQDTAAILRTMAIRNRRPDIPTFVQVNKSTSKRGVMAAGVADVVMCVDDFKYALMSFNCLCPGGITLIANLVRTCSPVADNMFSEAWRAEYHHGCANEVYRSKIPASLCCRPFVQAALEIYTNMGAILFAVQVRDEVTGGRRFVTNPGEHVIVHEGDVCFVIARGKVHADRVAELVVAGIETYGLSKPKHAVGKGDSFRPWEDVTADRTTVAPMPAPYDENEMDTIITSSGMGAAVIAGAAVGAATGAVMASESQATASPASTRRGVPALRGRELVPKLADISNALRRVKQQMAIPLPRLHVDLRTAGRYLDPRTYGRMLARGAARMRIPGVAPRDAAAGAVVGAGVGAAAGAVAYSSARPESGAGVGSAKPAVLRSRMARVESMQSMDGAGVSDGHATPHPAAAPSQQEPEAEPGVFMASLDGFAKLADPDEESMPAKFTTLEEATLKDCSQLNGHIIIVCHARVPPGIEAFFRPLRASHSSVGIAAALLPVHAHVDREAAVTNNEAVGGEMPADTPVPEFEIHGGLDNDVESDAESLHSEHDKGSVAGSQQARQQHGDTSVMSSRPSTPTDMEHDGTHSAAVNSENGMGTSYVAVPPQVDLLGFDTSPAADATGAMTTGAMTPSAAMSAASAAPGTPLAAHMAPTALSAITPTVAAASTAPFTSAHPATPDVPLRPSTPATGQVDQRTASPLPAADAHMTPLETHHDIPLADASADAAPADQAPLASNALFRPVLLVAENPPDEITWRAIGEYSNVFFYLGKLRSAFDLELANVRSAEVCVVLTNMGGYRGADSSRDEFMADADAIFTARAVQAYVYPRQMYTMTEIVHTDHVQFLRSAAEQRWAQEHAANSLSSKKMSRGARRFEMFPFFMYEHAFTMGRVMPSSILEALFVQEFYTPYLMNMVMRLIGGRQSSAEVAWGLPDTHLYLVPLPSRFSHETFADLFFWLVGRHQAIPFGLLRWSDVAQPKHPSQVRPSSPAPSSTGRSRTGAATPMDVYRDNRLEIDTDGPRAQTNATAVNVSGEAGRPAPTGKDTTRLVEGGDVDDVPQAEPVAPLPKKQSELEKVVNKIPYYQRLRNWLLSGEDERIAFREQVLSRRRLRTVGAHALRFTYVYANPPGELRLDYTDRVYVLASRRAVAAVLSEAAGTM